MTDIRNKEIERLRALHSPRRRIWKEGRYRDDLCTRCRSPYPCPVARLITGLDIAQELAGALEEATCPNCHGRLCMACVIREYHENCEKDCPACCTEGNPWGLQRIKALAEWVEWKGEG